LRLETRVTAKIAAIRTSRPVAASFIPRARLGRIEPR
jgi:hypothetical protein